MKTITAARRKENDKDSPAAHEMIYQALIQKKEVRNGILMIITSPADLEIQKPNELIYVCHEHSHENESW